MWVWLKIKQEGQTAGFCPWKPLSDRASILEFRFVEPQCEHSSLQLTGLLKEANLQNRCQVSQREAAPLSESGIPNKNIDKTGKQGRFDPIGPPRVPNSKLPNWKKKVGSPSTIDVVPRTRKGTLFD